MRFTTLDEWLTWQEAAHPSAIDLGLSRVQKVASALGVLAPGATVITVAGTNGKGSCVAAMAAMLKAAGRTFGAYTSPHILKYNERVQLNGVDASDEQLCSAFHAIDQARGETSLTYFEFGTLAALYLFSQEPLDYWLLEVGLGGRLDAINIVDPQLAVITSIAIDHVDWLGDNRESIGYEKAGICRQGIPLVCADPSPPASVVGTAQKLACTTYFLGKDFGFDEAPGTECHIWGQGYRYSLDGINLPKASVSAAVQALQILKAFDVEQSQLVESIAGLVLPGRMQTFYVSGKTVILDVAHNPAAMSHLAQQIKQRYPNKKMIVVLAMMQDKNIAESIAAMCELTSRWYLTTIQKCFRAAKASDLCHQLCQVEVAANYEVYASIRESLQVAINEASDEGDIILVTGSFFSVSEATAYLS